MRIAIASPDGGFVDYGTLSTTHSQATSRSSPRKATYLLTAATSASVALFLFSANWQPMTELSQLFARQVQVEGHFVNESGLYSGAATAPISKFVCDAPPEYTAAVKEISNLNTSAEDERACQVCLNSPSCRNLCIDSSSEDCTAISIASCPWHIIADMPTVCDNLDSSNTHSSPISEVKFDSLADHMPLTLCNACTDLSSPRTISDRCFALVVFYMARGHPASTISDGFFRDFPRLWCEPHMLNELSNPDLDPFLFGVRHAVIRWP